MSGHVEEYLDSDNGNDEAVTEVCSNDTEDKDKERTDNKPGNVSVPVGDKPMSKNQRKKMLRRQKYLAERPQRRINKKEKQKEKKLKRKLEGGEIEPQEPPKKTKVMDCADALPVRIAIDLSFDDLMSDRDILKLMKQVQRCYAVNRRADHPVQLYLTSFGGGSKDRLDAIGCQYQRWDVHIQENSLVDVFPKEDIIYLSSDSPNVLTEIDMSKVYVIGGLVDHNHHKGYCHRQAVEQGLKHAQLPLEEFIKIMSRKVLTVNHVFEILVHYCQSKDWQAAFHQAIPQRKVIPKVRRHGKAAAASREAHIEDSGSDENSEDEAVAEET